MFIYTVYIYIECFYTCGFDEYIGCLQFVFSNIFMLTVLKFLLNVFMLIFSFFLFTVCLVVIYIEYLHIYISYYYHWNFYLYINGDYDAVLTTQKETMLPYLSVMTSMKYRITLQRNILGGLFLIELTTFPVSSKVRVGEDLEPGRTAAITWGENRDRSIG